MSSMRIDGGDKKLLAEMASNSMSDCFAASTRTMLLPNHGDRVLGAQDALERIVALHGTRVNSLGLLLRHSASGIAVGTNAHCSASARQLPSCQGLSELGELATDYCMSDIDDLSDDFNFMDAALSELEEDGVEVEKVVAEQDEISVLSLSSNFKGATRVHGRHSSVKETKKVLVGSRKRRKRTDSLHDSITERRQKLPCIFQRRWLTSKDINLVNNSNERISSGRGKSDGKDHIIQPSSHLQMQDKEGGNEQQYGTWSLLCLSMTRSCSTQTALQDWDRMNGLPASHARSMIKSARSRKMLQDYINALKLGAPS